MSDKTRSGVHWSFWAVGAFALIWNGLGGVNFFMQMNAETLEAYREVERAIIDGRPVWATGGFAVGVFGGALGGLLLLLRKPTAYYLFIAALLGVIVTMIHTINIARSTIDFSPAEILVMILLPLIVAAFLVWYSKKAERKGWISQKQVA